MEKRQIDYNQETNRFFFFQRPQKHAVNILCDKMRDEIYISRRGRNGPQWKKEKIPWKTT